MLHSFLNASMRWSVSPLSRTPALIRASPLSLGLLHLAFSVPSSAFMAEHMQRARLSLPVGNHGLLGEVPRTRLLHDVGKPRPSAASPRQELARGICSKS